MKAIQLICRPGAHFHFGKTGIDATTALSETDNIIHSDTLYAAWVNTLAEIYDQETVNELRVHLENGNLSFSSVFHCLENEGNIIWFLPKPAHYQQYVKDDFKNYKRIKFISKKIWEEGILPENWLNQSQCIELRGGFLVTREEAEEFLNKSEEAARDIFSKSQVYKEITLPKVFVHKLSKKNSVYTVTNIEIVKSRYFKVHFYFLMNAKETFKESEDYQKLLMALRLLIDSGIGGERSTGCGQLRGMKVHDFKFEMEDKPHKSVLSVSIPKNENEFDQYKFYQTLTRGGRRTAKDGDLKHIRVIAEGAFITKKITGKPQSIRVNKAGKEYIRNGAAFCVPVFQKLD